jgi:hypothetical protein
MMICPTRRLLVHHSNHHQFGAKLRVSMIFLFALLLFPVAAQSFMIGMGTKQSAVFKTSLGVRGGGDEKSNKDQLVLVTGSSRGIGAAICRALAREGYKIAINYRDNKDEAQSLVKEIEEMGTGSEVHAFQADVSKEEEVKRMFDGVQQTFGMPPTGLVNNAGIMEMMEKDICKISRDTLDADLAVNTYGPFFCIKVCKAANCREYSSNKISLPLTMRLFLSDAHNRSSLNVPALQKEGKVAQSSTFHPCQQKVASRWHTPCQRPPKRP